MAVHSRCPECGTSVKASNLAGHYERVHPRATVTKEARAAIQKEPVRSRPRSHTDRRILAIAALIVALIGGGIYAYVSIPTAAGRIDVEPTVWDFGEVQQAVVSHTFEVRNLGSTPLRLDGISTSCMCTSAEFADTSGTSPRFGFHSNPPWQHTIGPGARGVLTVFYDPTVHPERGHFQRDVYVLSSDPSQREVIITIHVTEA